MSDDTEVISPLASYRDLPLAGDQVFRINDELVRFTVGVDEDGSGGWIVTTTHPNYTGFLRRSNDTVSTVNGSELTYEYAFKITGTPYFGSGLTAVTVAELRNIYFGEPRTEG